MELGPEVIDGLIQGLWAILYWERPETQTINNFDLCEACYEVLDAGQLPSLHSIDHPMSAIPIDNDSISGNEDLNGWMETTSGFRAIPVMQLFYRLSSAIGGPFMGSSKSENLDLEKFVKWLLEEINLNKPFQLKRD
ncbi:hypothetical protein ZIOFF_072522 [Zingiber officinale]|uniref:Uncharacterized protein n=1 Tax=Zingiber officinale TaxID=94328 RepID=A0A8J5C7U3_ZINOF|nr:hypothetical protein ZIOFF_072522 [Zingiber officinale]